VEGTILLIVEGTLSGSHIPRKICSKNMEEGNTKKERAYITFEREERDLRKGVCGKILNLGRTCKISERWERDMEEC